MEADYQEPLMEFEQIWAQARHNAYAELENLRQQAKKKTCNLFHRYNLSRSGITKIMIVFLCIF
jgi:hypothetical protein